MCTDINKSGFIKQNIQKTPTQKTRKKERKKERIKQQNGADNKQTREVSLTCVCEAIPQPVVEVGIMGLSPIPGVCGIHKHSC